MKRSSSLRLLAFAFVASALFVTQFATPARAQRSAGEEASNTETAELVEDPDGDQQRAELPSAARRESLQRRAGEKTSRGPQGRAVVLGMHIQETDYQRAKVVDVATSSAAFDAGIRKGDEIVTFDGFHADKYRDWIDGMRRLTRDVPDGDSLPIVINRNGERLELRVRVPVATAGGLPPEDTVARNQQVVPAQPGPTNVFVPGQPARAVGGAGDNVLVANAFGDEFNDVEGGVTESAIAEIFSLNRPLRTPPADPNAEAVGVAGQNVAADGQRQAAAAPAGQRIGLAGFRNDANGLFVMVDVGNLPPGNYLVNFEDPGVLNTAPVNYPAVPAPRGDIRSGQLGPNNPAVTPADTAPAPINAVPKNTTPGTPRQGQPQSRLAFPRTILAQVVDSSSPVEATRTPGVGPTDIPATGNVEPLDTPPTGQVNPSGATPTGLPRTADARRDPSRTGDARTGDPQGGAVTNQIGTLTVDQSGTGRLQQTVEGLQVQDIVGQAIVLYSTNPSANTPLPPDLDATADPATPPNVDRQSTPAGRAASGATIPGREQNTRRAAASGVGEQTPVAGGLIRLISDTSTPPNGSATTPQQPNVQTQDAPAQGVEAPSVPAPGAVE